MKRRTALKLIGVGTASFAFPACSAPLKRVISSFGKDENPLETLDGWDFNPIDRSIGDQKKAVFSGDDPDRTHGILWDKENFIRKSGGIPEPTERVPLVIVGGGVSGSLSAYLLRDLKPIVLERADRFGGNARGESWRGIDYSIGAAYFMEQAEDAPLRKIYDELGFNKMYRVKTTDDPIVLNKKRFDAFWDGETDPKHRDQFEKLRDYFKATLSSVDGLTYPELPIIDPAQRQKIRKLDSETFREHLTRIAGGKLHPHISAAMEHYCWSSFAASFSEVSAAAGLNFYAAEFGEVYIMPGGNSAACEQILKKALDSVPLSHFRPRSVVCDVHVVSDGAIVTYADSENRLKSIHAKAVIMACPKFVVSRVLRDIEPSRLEAIQRLRYHSYLVANVLINQPIKDDFYDLFLIGKGSPDKDFAKASERQKVTDIVLGSYAKPDRERSVLTLYRGIPYDGARPILYSDGAYGRIRSEFEEQVHQDILPLVGVAPEKIVDMRITRWGHPLPMAQQGLFADGTLDRISAPFKERVFFVEQDNWMLPSFETGTTDAIFTAPKVRKAIQGA